MISVEQKFVDNIREILESGSVDRDVRPSYADGTKAYTKFITQVAEKYDIGAGEFPITGLRPIAWKSGLKEILWIYQDASNDLDLLKSKYNVSWWDSWDIGDRTIGACYGAIVRKYDLMQKLLEGLQNNPFGRRHILSLWQYEELRKTHGLDPCAFEILCTVRESAGELYLDMTLIQRSSDYLVAGHINKMQYVCLLLMIARHTRYKPGNFMHFVQNLHMYDRHMQQAEEILRRFQEYRTKEEREGEFSLSQKPRILLNTEKTDFYSFSPDDFSIEGYHSLEQLKFELAI